MKIDDDHMYHGSAMIQIAEHPQFTAINSLKIKEKILRTAYKINDDIGIFLKYGKSSKKPFKEYVFTFHSDHLTELSSIASVVNKLFLALVCVKDREICCLSYSDFLTLIEKRKKDKGIDEEQYQILVNIPKGKSIRVYVNAAGVRKTILDKPLIISRNDFPETLFG